MSLKRVIWKTSFYAKMLDKLYHMQCECVIVIYSNIVLQTFQLAVFGFLTILIENLHQFTCLLISKISSPLRNRVNHHKTLIEQYEL